jgi:apolipoprotein D and lipocalin family protein
MKIFTRSLLLLGALLMFGCSSKPMKTVDYVDLPRFMGDWYVIASIPTFLEKDIYNAVETYRLDDDGTVATTFTFRKGGFDGEQKTMTPRGFIRDTETNALWGMQFIWPLKGDYRVVYLDADYQVTVIGRKARDYVWLMSRKPTMSEDEYARMTQFIASLGYDVSKLKRVPQKWP